MFSEQRLPRPPRTVVCRMGSIMSEILDVLLDLIRACEPFPPSVSARVFAAIYNAVVELGGVLSIPMFALGVPVKILSLGESFGAIARRTCVWFIVRVPMLAVLVLVKRISAWLGNRD